MLRELEAKFRVHAPFELPPIVGAVPLVDAVDDPREDRLTAVYYDTSDLRLAREGVTLRRRAGGKDAGWHLKLPVTTHTVPDGTGARDEMQLPDSAELPDELRDLVTAWVRAAPLGPVATLVTDRTTWLFRSAEGVPLAELVDDTVTVEDSSHIHARFREIEVEDVGGGADVVAHIGGVLQDAGAVGGEFVPKVVRALGRRATAPPEPPPATPLGARATAQQAVEAALRSCTRELMEHDVRIRRELPGGAAALRDAARRLRTILRAFAALFDAECARSLAAELGWLAGELKAEDDIEALSARLLRIDETALVDALPTRARPADVGARVEQALEADLAAAHARVLETLRSERYLALIEQLVETATKPQLTEQARGPAGAVLIPMVRASWRKLARRCGRISQPRDVAVAVLRGEVSERYVLDHRRARAAARRFCHLCDAVAPVVGPAATELREQVERVHAALSQHQQSLSAARFVGGPINGAGGRGAGPAFGIGVLYALQCQGVLDARAEVGRLWQSAASPKLRRWLED